MVFFKTDFGEDTLSGDFWDYLKKARDTISMDNIHQKSIDDIVAILDNYAMNEGSRMKIKVEDGEGEVLSRQYHHGRCDVGSPWAKGAHFDVLE